VTFKPFCPKVPYRLSLSEYDRLALVALVHISQYHVLSNTVSLLISSHHWFSFQLGADETSGR
jgi:hypothetical protein